jgi:chromosome segregation ATPase
LPKVEKGKEQAEEDKKELKNKLQQAERLVDSLYRERDKAVEGQKAAETARDAAEQEKDKMGEKLAEKVVIAPSELDEKERKIEELFEIARNREENINNLNKITTDQQAEIEGLRNELTREQEEKGEIAAAKEKQLTNYRETAQADAINLSTQLNEKKELINRLNKLVIKMGSNLGQTLTEKDLLVAQVQELIKEKENLAQSQLTPTEKEFLNRLPQEAFIIVNQGTPTETRYLD